MILFSPDAGLVLEQISIAVPCGRLVRTLSSAVYEPPALRRLERGEVAP
jgi:hypothetical protein